MENDFKYTVIFHENSNGYSESYDYILKLAQKSSKSKDARIKYNKITEYMRILKTIGVEVGEPYIKHIQGVDGLYELRPLRDRFFFIYEEDNKYVILNHFQKSTQKTPKKEIEKAIKYIRERKNNENF